MARYKAPDFNERSANARAAKQSALEALRAKPAPDPAVVAERIAAQEAREAAAAERSAARKLAAEEAKAAKIAAAEAAAAAALAALPPPPPPKLTPEEQKALRDAKYAARKARKR